MFNLLLVCLVVVVSSISVASKSGDELEGLEYLGCYKDRGWNNRAFRERYFNARGYIKWARWADLSYIVKICENVLKKLDKGLTVFSVENWGECRTDLDDQYHFKSYENSSKCYSHVADSFANAVYRIKENCNVNDPLYVNGITRYIPVNRSICHACRCIKGQTKCNAITCDYAEEGCEKYLLPSKGACCGKCGCHHLGKDKMEGEEWDDRRKNGTCKQCRCVRGEASCTLTTCSENCPEPERIPGKCCPRCKPKAPITSPWEIITLPTTPPPFTWPSWIWKSHGFGKRSLKKKRRMKSKTFTRKGVQRLVQQ